MNFEPVCDPYRATGRSIRQLLRIIIAMSERPGHWIHVSDHHHTHKADEHLLHWIKDVCKDGLHMDVETTRTNDGFKIRFIQNERTYQRRKV